MKISDEVLGLRAEVTKLRAELETERMRLAACGVVAMANTPESAKAARDMHQDYRSASCDDVARMVDENMKLRADIAAEREACAKVCEERGPARVLSGEDCAAAIRARGEK
jgi:hypothetical protein